MFSISVPIAIGDRTHIYKADVLSSPAQDVPALMGIPDMAALGALICCKTGRFILPGPGGLELRASPGTTEVRMDKEAHWLLGVRAPEPGSKQSGHQISKSENRLLSSWCLDH